MSSSEALSHHLYEGEGEFWTQHLIDRVWNWRPWQQLPSHLGKNLQRYSSFGAAALVVYLLAKWFSLSSTVNTSLGSVWISLFAFLGTCTILFLVVFPVLTASDIVETREMEKNSSNSELRICIDSHWYNLTKWQSYHPGGTAILQHLHGKDATDAFYSLHSKEAVAKLSRFSKTKAQVGEVAPPTKLETEFRKFREQLEKGGWFTRSLVWDFFYVGSIFLLVAVGTWTAFSYPLVAITCLGVAMQQAGWCAHDYIHQRGRGPKLLGYILATVNSLSRSWWSDKHNTHHVYPNTLGIDTDIANDPVLHLWIPEPSKDHAMRAYQQFYYLPVYAFLYLSWRIQSLQFAWATKNHLELFCFAINYLWLFFLPWYVSIGSVLLGGFLVGVVVTATHQSEEIFEEKEREFCFVKDQFLTTRNAVVDSPVLHWLWGGMQYQLEHHLFPTMPKCHFPAVRPLLKEFAEKNGVEYREDNMWDLLARNYFTMVKYSKSSSRTKGE